MLYPHDFFPQENLERLGDLFELDKPVWETIRRLKEILKDIIAPNVAHLPQGKPLEEGFILYEGELIPHNEVRIELGDATKGKLKVWYKGRELPGASVLCAGAILMDGEIEIGRGVLVEPGALIKGPTIIGDCSEVRQGAYVRGNCFVGKGCVVGHTTELKGAVMLDGAKAGHFAYLGDSILGHEVNLGAGTKLANLKLRGKSIKIRLGKEVVDTGLRKLGAILGDRVQTGCNSVTNPGTLIGPESLVLPNTTAGPGYFQARSILR
jgi:acetyltransferase-like isoleucine patch superfamily enzyme